MISDRANWIGRALIAPANWPRPLMLHWSNELMGDGLTPLCLRTRACLLRLLASKQVHRHAPTSLCTRWLTGHTAAAAGPVVCRKHMLCRVMLGNACQCCGLTSSGTVLSRGYMEIGDLTHLSVIYGVVMALIQWIAVAWSLHAVAVPLLSIPCCIY